MSKMVLVTVHVEYHEGDTEAVMAKRAIEEAEVRLDDYIGLYYDHYDFDVRNGLTDKDGAETTACRACDFHKFTSIFSPEVIISDYYIDSCLMTKYNVSWDYVIWNEMRDFMYTGCSALQCWLVYARVHS